MDSIKNIIKEEIESYLTKKLNALNGIKYLYHATPACNLNSIKKYGLGGKISNFRLWDYNKTPYQNINHGCFLATDEYVAESYVESSEAFEDLQDAYEEKYGTELEIIVFKIDVNDLDLNLLSIDDNQEVDDDSEHTFFYNGIIPFDKLQIIELY